MQSITLRDAAQAVNGTLELGLEETIGEVCIDTRKITAGCLYIAIKGDNFDGHDFIEKAFELGAKAAVSNRRIESEHPIILVEDTRKALGMLAGYYRSLFPIPVVGVTGSVGKTSTKEMIYTVLSRNYRVLKTQGNFNNDIGLPLTLFGLEAAHTGAVIEMGMSALGEISYLSEIARPTLAVITNIGVSHLENLGSRENILKAKLEILDGMEDTATIIMNADNDLLRGVADDLQGRARYFGIEHNADVMAEQVRQNGTNTEFTLLYQGERYAAAVPAIGIHNVYNALAGFLAGIELGISPEEIVASFADYQNAAMRQNVREFDGIQVIEDCYNASPDSMKAAVDVISTIQCSGKRIAVFGDMLELGSGSAELHRAVGEMAAQSGIDQLICFGEQAESMQKGALDTKESSSFNLFVRFFPAQDREKMISFLRKEIKSGDAIIFKASRGIKLEQVIEALFESKPHKGEDDRRCRVW